eukprot:15792-Heterococcus_DN1.PRE.4
MTNGLSHQQAHQNGEYAYEATLHAHTVAFVATARARRQICTSHPGYTSHDIQICSCTQDSKIIAVLRNGKATIQAYCDMCLLEAVAWCRYVSYVY